jgi:hypothetical protein
LNIQQQQKKLNQFLLIKNQGRKLNPPMGVTGLKGLGFVLQLEGLFAEKTNCLGFNAY